MSADRPGILLALTPVAERSIESWLFGAQATVVPVGSIAEADELERGASAGAIAALISPGLSGVTPGHVERARARGLRFVGIALDEHDADALRSLGVDDVVDAASSPDALMVHLDGTSVEGSRPIADTTGASRAFTEQAGTLLAVVGTKGASGASECAASLALLAAHRWPTMLVELDLLGGGLDVRTGGDAHDGSIVGLVRAAASGEEHLGDLVERWLALPPGWPPILLAPAAVDESIRDLAQPGAIAGALRVLTSRMPLTICDVGSLLAGGEPIPAVARAHREALVAADAVLLVLGARDAHLRPGLAQLDLLIDSLAIPSERLRIAINGIDGPGAGSQRDLDQTLVPRLAERGLTADAWLTWDRRALDRSRRKGLPLAAVKRHGRYTRVLAHLLDELFLPAEPTPRRRKRRLPVPTTAAARAQQEEVAIPWPR